MLKNRKGFMLVEVIVVASVTIGVLVTLFIGLNRVSSAYEVRNKYFDIDAAYISAGVNEVLIRTGSINELLRNHSESQMISAKSFNSPNHISAVRDYISNYGNNYNQIYIYFSPYNSTKISSLKGLEGNLTFEAYLDYISGHYNFEEKYTYVVITELCHTRDDCRYYGLRVK